MHLPVLAWCTPSSERSGTATFSTWWEIQGSACASQSTCGGRRSILHLVSPSPPWPTSRPEFGPQFLRQRRKAYKYTFYLVPGARQLKFESTLQHTEVSVGSAVTFNHFSADSSAACSRSQHRRTRSATFCLQHDKGSTRNKEVLLYDCFGHALGIGEGWQKYCLCLFVAVLG